MQQNPTQDMQPQLSAVCSMTGYGRARQMIGNKEITVELRSVNHRFLEYSSRVPRAYAYLEDKLKNLVKGSVSRGKVDVTLSVQTISGTDTQVVINHDLARSYLEALRDLAEDLQIKNDVSVSQMARFSDIFSVVKVEENEEEMWQAVQQVAQQAVQNFVDMRRAEGEKMKQDLLNRLQTIEQLVARVEELSPKTVENYTKRLYAKLQEVLQSNTVDDQRVLTEAAVFAEKIAVAEETVRLGHQFRQSLSSSEPVGRKLDFLVQEFNREANTIGSKAQDLEIARIVVDLKSEIEKIREQIQNIE
mgnify:CR=1 FL=1